MMNPFVRRDKLDDRWYVDAARWNPACYKGTAWGGYETWREAFDAALVARAAA